MKKIFIICMLLFTFFGCSHADYIGGGVMLGTDTEISAFGSHVKKGEDIKIYGAHIEAGKIKEKFRYGLESDISYHKYTSEDPKRDGKRFLAIDVGLFTTYDFIYTPFWQLYFGAGAGLGYAPLIDEEYPLVGSGGLIGVFDYRLGWRKQVEWGEFSIEYKSKHWSEPFYNDQGENDDIIYFKFAIPF